MDHREELDAVLRRALADASKARAKARGESPLATDADRCVWGEFAPREHLESHRGLARIRPVECERCCDACSVVVEVTAEEMARRNPGRYERLASSNPEARYSVAVPCEGATVRRRVLAYNAAQLPGYYVGAGVHQDTPDVVQALVRRACEGALERGLYLFGPVGTGKSYAAWRIAGTLALVHGLSVRWVTVSELLRRLRDSYQKDKATETQRDIMRPLLECQWLVLDDLGKTTKEHERRVIDEIVDTRMLERRHVIVTSNLSLEQLAKQLDERIASRLGLCEVVNLKGRDRRRW